MRRQAVAGNAAAARPWHRTLRYAPVLRRPAGWGLLLVVTVAHLLLANRLGEDRIGWGSGDRPPAPIEVTFVRSLQATAPPAAAPAAAPADARHLPAVVVRAAAQAASAAAAQADAASPAADAATSDQPAAAPAGTTPDSPGSADGVLARATPAPDAVAPATLPMPPAEAQASEPPPRGADTSPPPASTAREPLPASAPDAPPAVAAMPTAPAQTAAASAAQAAPPASAPPQAFAWPPSTRLSYKLSGHYRGPVDGTAQVEWLREGSRYQVRMGTRIGLVLERNIVSEGELTDRGLAPRRFTGEQKFIFTTPRRWGLAFDAQRIVLVDGKEVPTERGVQDEASQFVQLTWLFTTQPQRLAVGQSIELPLVISRRLDRWVYDVVGEETLWFPFGTLPTFHVKPRREASGGDLTAEMWIAPTLQYLPVRILIRQGIESWANLTLLKAPEQAER